MQDQELVEHLSFETLTAFLEGKMSPIEQRRVKAHVDSCTDCQYEFNTLRRMFGAMKESSLVAPPPNLIDRMLIAFRRKQVQPAQRPHRQAELQFDSWARLALAGLRGPQQDRQLLFSESAFDLDLLVVKDHETGSFVLCGQILNGESQSFGLEGMEIKLSSADIQRYRVSDRLGRFCFSQLPKGVYKIQVSVEDRIISLGPVLVEDSWTYQDTGSPD